MAQRIVVVPGIGPVRLVKRRGAKNLRLSVNTNGQVRLGLPMWMPYGAGLAFARNQQEWIKSQLANNQLALIRDGDYIGRSHQIKFITAASKGVAKTRLDASSIHIISSKPPDDAATQSAARRAAEKALRQQAEKLLPPRVAKLATKQRWHYQRVRIRRLNSRWGSYSSEGSITLSYFLVQLPWTLIDYVIVHELVHSHHPNHSRQFWAAFTQILPDARDLQKQIRSYQPRIEPRRTINI